MKKVFHDVELVENLMEGLPPLISCKQAEGLLNISRASIYRLLDNGDLERVQFSMAGSGAKETMRITNTSIKNLLISWSTKETR